MKKNILVLVGSPRPKGNSQVLAEAFAVAAREKGHETEVLRVSGMKIAGCQACERCWKKDGLPCVQQDDMQKLFPKLNVADMIVFAAPIYYFGFPAQLKAVIDRFYPLCHGDDKRRAFADKESALILCGASEEEDDFEPAVANYEVMADYLGWEDRGILVASGLGDIGDAAKSEWLEAARDLAMDL
ncbi:MULTISPECIES: flavodoxin family protein [Anaerotruncus]|uniref:flavodoxin family protein n=1 Tax=Anaerotruncus TaxID=244127 RepID=UPI00210DEDFE|nr:flavodoxin family protein [Anaerotruncus sp. DFI.9.16]MCQ4897443.1 flavodoxin family protein [Anaerotruncus sp. DFI.9.16]